MKLRAIRLSEVGQFRDGVALEGLTGRLDVVPGPNEFGKSTLFRAVETVMRVPYTGTAANIHELAPSNGGAPLIEVEFETAGNRWRLRKRYLAQKSAELLDLGGGTVLRGADAENRLAALMAGRLGRDRMLGLLWVGQTHSLDLPGDKKGEISKSLGRLIEDEIADAAGEGQARRLREAVTAALEGLVSRSTRKPAAGKPYKAAIDACARARDEFEMAAAAAAAAAKRLVELNAAEGRAQVLASPEAAAERASVRTVLSKSLADGLKAEEALQRANLQVAARQVEDDAARDRLQRLQSAIAEALLLEQRLAAATSELATVRRKLDSGKSEAAAAEARRIDAEERLTQLQDLLDTHDRHQRYQGLMATVAELRQRLAVARLAEIRVSEIKTTLATDPIDEGKVGELRRALGEVERLWARFEAALPKVRIDYAAGAEGRIRNGAVVVATSGEIAAAPSIILEVEGVGRITIAAPVAAGEDVAALLVAASARVSDLQTSMAVENLAAAEARLEHRQRLANESLVMAERAAAAAPSGLAALERQVATMQTELESMDVAVNSPTSSRAETAVELAAARATVKQVEAAVRAAQQAVQAATMRETRLESDISGSTQRLTQLEADLVPAAQRDREVAAARETLAASTAALNAAVREQSAWTAGVLTPAARTRLERDLADAERAERSIEDERRKLAFEINGLQSALVRDRQDGVEAALDEARAALRAAEERVAGFEREVAELSLIERLLEEEAQAARASELKPVVDRLEDVARNVFPDARFQLGDKLDVTGLVRQDSGISNERLSGGTREQIAVLVRLAYARLLADRGEALPLILDDALVYADAARFRAMFDALIAASAHHQIIMLTCHEERVATLGQRPGLSIGSLNPWRPA